MKLPALIIPALNPDTRLIDLISKLKKIQPDFYIVLVNDGSKSECTPIFDKLRVSYDCVICSHSRNMGKGAALKTGIKYAYENDLNNVGYVTADADGQHSAEDIIKVSLALLEYPDSLILGTRIFTGKEVPFKSCLGNRITSVVFRLETGVRCEDTQTGLRGLPVSYIQKLLEIVGNRFEYEMNVLLQAAKDHIPFITIPIKTIYIEGNSSSHFHPVRDSIQVYSGILKFGLSSLLSSVVDILFFTIFVKILFGTSGIEILAATIAARICSGACNFTFNKKWVFSAGGRSNSQAIKYFGLMITQMLFSAFGVWILSKIPIPLTLVKVFVDCGLFLLSYNIQRRFIFILKEIAPIK